VLGEGYRLVIHAQGGLAAMLFLDVRLAPAPLPTPFGTAHLDLGTALGTPILPMGSPSLPIDLVVPTVPQLAGLVLYSQAVVLRAGAGLRWTNLLGDLVFF
jgi:hypothetical protein